MSNKDYMTVFILTAVPLCISLSAPAEDPYPTAWVRQSGTPASDYCYALAADSSGNVYISGLTYGDIGGPNAGGGDAFLSKYSPTGSPLWTRQLGTSRSDYSYGVAVDGLDSVYISGRTMGDLYESNSGGWDAFIARYNATGDLLWTRQLGTSGHDLSHGVAADGQGNVYISGFTEGALHGANAGNYDVFVSKYDAEGDLLWTRQTGTPSDDIGHGVSIDGFGNVCIAGYTEGDLGAANLGSLDAFVSKYDANGYALWTRQIGTANAEMGTSVAADDLGNVYTSGWTQGDLDGSNAGGPDAFLSKYDAAGDLVWIRQLGTTGEDGSTGMITDIYGNVYISGWTAGVLGDTNAGGHDAFVSKYDARGDLLWTRQIGTPAMEQSSGVAVDGLGNVHIGGFTEGDLGGPNAGPYDAFVAKFQVPEPATLSLLALGGLTMLRRRRR